MQWQDSLLDLEGEYDFENEDPAGEINRIIMMVAWLLLIRTTKGYEDLIEDEVQSGERIFIYLTTDEKEYLL